MSGFLAFWLTGLVFLFCCGTMNVPAATVEFCPLAKSGSHCDKAKSDTNEPTFSDKSEGIYFDCCAFLPKLFEKTRKFDNNQQTARVSDKLKIDLPRFSVIEKGFRIQVIYQSPIPFQNKLFIKNQVFRI